MKIKRVVWSGNLDFRRVHPQTWETTRSYFKEKYNADLPHWYNLPKDRDQLRVVLSPIHIDVYLKDGTVLEYDVKPGYITDFASVPKCLRSLVDNDSLEIILAALVHDANFGGHRLSFGRANSIFRQMIRDPGNGGYWLALWAWLGVSTPKGRRIYENKTDSEIKRNRALVSFNWAPSAA